MFPNRVEAQPRPACWLAMPYGKKPGQETPERRGEIRLLREIAQRLREIAHTHRTAMSEKLVEVAKEFEDHADEMERRRRR